MYVIAKEKDPVIIPRFVRIIFIYYLWFRFIAYENMFFRIVRNVCYRNLGETVRTNLLHFMGLRNKP